MALPSNHAALLTFEEMAANAEALAMAGRCRHPLDIVFDPVGPADVVAKSKGKGKQPAQAEEPEADWNNVGAELPTLEEGDRQEWADAPRSFPHEDAAKALRTLRVSDDPVLPLVQNQPPKSRAQIPKAVPPKVNEANIKNSLAKRVSSVFLSEVKQHYGLDPHTKREEISWNVIMQAATYQLDDVHDEMEDLAAAHQRQTDMLYAENAALRRQVGALRGEVEYQAGMITAQALELPEQDEEIDALKAAAILTDITIADQQSELRRLRRLAKTVERASMFENW